MRFVLSFSWHSIRQWKWRLLIIALLVAITFTLHVLYASFTSSAQLDFLEDVPELVLPYGLLVVVEPRDRILSQEELPAYVMPTRVRTELEVVEMMVEAIYTIADSSYGSFSLLGIHADSNFFGDYRFSYQGRLPSKAGEILLPREMAVSAGLSVDDRLVLSSLGNSGQWDVHLQGFQVVGLYENNDLAQAFVLYEDAARLSGLRQANACLIDHISSLSSGYRPDIVGWLRASYPHATFVHATVPELLSTKLLSNIHQPSRGILLLIVVFGFVGITTIAITTYLGRRREYAALKSLGTSKKQLIALFSIEYGMAEALGLTAGALTLVFLSRHITWITDNERHLLLNLGLSAAILTLIAVILALLYPVATALVASVNQLLYARKIPFLYIGTDHLERPDSEQVYLERAKNVRLLKLIAEEEGQSDIQLLKTVGERVKKGETVALQERIFGYVIYEWRAFCDGKVVGIDSNGLIIIRPDDENEDFFPYPRNLLAEEERRRKIIPSENREP